MATTHDLQARLTELATGADFETSVSVLHTERGERAAVNGNRRFPTCSVFKVPVLVEAYRQAAAGEFSLLNRWQLDDEDKSVGSGVLQTLDARLAPTVHDLATLMIIISDNTAADILTRRLGPERITGTMRELGLDDTWISVTCREMIAYISGSDDVRELPYERSQRLKANPPAPDSRAYEAGEDNDVTSADDMVNLFSRLITGERMDAIGLGRRDLDGILRILYRQQLNDRLPRYLPPTAPFAHKTGSLGGAMEIHNDAGVMTLENGEHVAIAAFTRAPVPQGIAPRDLSALRRRLDDFIADAALAAYEHYSN
ncbi:MAG: serine hydrolase [Dehalococcoidia bacterium]